jgi:glycerophosphoryl diester phosphodiesterase
VADRTAAELAGLDVPLFRDVLTRYPRIPLIVELKESTFALAQAVVTEVRRANAESRVCLGSFSAAALRHVRAAAPEIATSAGRFEVRMALYRSWVRCSPGRVPFQAFQVPETSGNTRVVSPRFVELAHRVGLAVQVWTVDDPADIHRLLDWGVDAIISDRPDIAAEVLHSRQSTVVSRQ